MPKFEDFHGSTDHIEAPEWGLAEGDNTESAQAEWDNAQGGREIYVDPSIEAWRREHGIDVIPDGQRLEVMGGDKGDWIVDARDQSQVRAAEGLMSDESKGWTLQ